MYIKNKIIQLVTLIFFISSMALLSACKKSFLERKPLDSFSSGNVWLDQDLSRAFVNDIYNGFGNGGFKNKVLADYTDEAMFGFTDGIVKTIVDATIGPDDLGSTNDDWEWSSMYGRIRGCNIAIYNLNASTLENKGVSQQLNGEAHFLRAFFYHQLLRYHGGVPIITKLYGLSDDYSIARNTFEECVNFIVADCDTAIQLLENINIDKGHAGKLSALALKSRVLTYAASDLYDIPTAKLKSSVIAGYSNPEYIGYVSGDRNARRRAAKQAALAILNATSGYKTNLNALESRETAINNYISLSMAGGSKFSGVDKNALEEMIFGIFKVPESGGGDMTVFNLINGPNGYGGWGITAPIGQMVDDYQMLDGSNFDWDDPSKAATPYKNRDPRLYGTVLFDGADWKSRTNDDPYSQTQYGKYELVVKNQFGVYEKKEIAGLDSRDSRISPGNASKSGYSFRRFSDPDPAVHGELPQYIPWPLLRYSEAIFNYAEACNDLVEDEADAINWLNKIRFRSGMPAIPAGTTGAALQEVIRHEKKIEMAFEEQRFFDIRRWMIAPSVVNFAKIVEIKGTFKAGKELKDSYKYDTSIYDYKYTTSTTTHESGKRIWHDKMYFKPIKRDETYKNTLLINNPGY